MTNRELWPYYDRELRFLESQARDFGREYQKEAGYLALGPNGRSTDPHVERMIQAFALLAARVHHKVDDDFPELTEALLNLLHPHYLAPLPSMLVAQFVPNPGADLVKGLPIPRHTSFRTTAVQGVQCDYRTVYPTRLWPVEVAAAQFKGPPYTDVRDLLPEWGVPPGGAKSRVLLQLRLPVGVTFESLALGEIDPDTGEPAALRFFLDADGPLTTTLYELLFNNVRAVVFRAPGERTFVTLTPDEAIRPVGFGCGGPGNVPALDEGVLPYPPHVFPGYRLLTEFFAYRDKFWFFDLAGWGRVRQAGVLKQNVLEVHFFLNHTVKPEQEQAVGAATFRLGAVPMVNLFTKGSTEAIDLSRQRYDHPVVPDSDKPHGFEVYSVDRVFHRLPSGVEVEYEPFYSFRHQDLDRSRRYWLGRRRPSRTPRDLERQRDDEPVMDRGTEMELNFVDCDFNPRAPAEALALAAVTCCNRELPAKLRENPERWRLQPVGFGLPAEVRVLRQPTPTLRPAQKRLDANSPKMTYWRVISHLTLNHLSLTDKARGREALTEYLALYDFSDDQNADLAAVALQVREGVLSIDSVRDVAFVPGEIVGGYARGLEVKFELDEEKFVGVGAYLFAAVMERFFGLAVSMNSFTRLTYSTRQRRFIKGWPARAGEQALV